jgi:hypothetical protein
MCGHAGELVAGADTERAIAREQQGEPPWERRPAVAQRPCQAHPHRAAISEGAGRWALHELARHRGRTVWLSGAAQRVLARR